jgi:4-hydroxybenzoate polyprenyltransferase
MESILNLTWDRHLWRERLSAYSRFIKIEHTLFSLPLLFAGAVLAAGEWPSWRVTLWILAAGIGARTLALSVNRMIDREIDRKNPRTASRELAQGTLSLKDAILISVAGLLLYLWAAAELSDFCLLWSWVPVLLFVIYPTLKRFTWLSHFGLGVTWAMAPLGGWFAVRPGFEGVWPALILAVFSFFWLAGFDIIYATLDEEFDRQEGLYSLPARLGRRWALRVSALLHWGAFACLAALYATSLRGVGASFLMLVAGSLLFFEHLLIDNVDLAFFKLNVITGFVVLAMVLWGVPAGL